MSKDVYPVQMRANKDTDKDLSQQRLEDIRCRLEDLIISNRSDVGSGQDVGEIEKSLFSGVLELGKLLLEDRIIEENESLEQSDYTIESKKK